MSTLNHDFRAKRRWRVIVLWSCGITRPAGEVNPRRGPISSSSRRFLPPRLQTSMT